MMVESKALLCQDRGAIRPSLTDLGTYPTTTHLPVPLDAADELVEM